MIATPVSSQLYAMAVRLAINGNILEVGQLQALALDVQRMEQRLDEIVDNARADAEAIDAGGNVVPFKRRIGL